MTTLYQLNVLSALDVDGTTEYEAWTSVGDSTSPGVSETEASVTGSGVRAYVSDANGTITWYSRPLQAVTISGTISIVLTAGEDSMSANQQIGILIDRVNSAGAYQSTIYDGGKNVELPLGSQTNSWTGTPTSTSMSNGDRIRIRVYFTQFGTGGTGYTDTFWWDSTLGQHYIAFTETLTEYSGATISGSFTADAILRKNSGTKTFTANAILRKTQTGSFTANAILRKTVTPTPFALDAILRKTQTGTFTANAILRKTVTPTPFALDAILRKTVTPTPFALDAILRKTASGQFAAAAILLRSHSDSLDAQAILKATSQEQ